LVHREVGWEKGKQEKRGIVPWGEGFEVVFQSAYWLEASFASNFKHCIPEARKTICEGISLDLKPRAWQPRGKFLSQVTKKCRHWKQSTFSGFMDPETA